MIERHGLCRETPAVHEVHAYGVGLEKLSRDHPPPGLRIPLVAASQTIWSA